MHLTEGYVGSHLAHYMVSSRQLTYVLMKSLTRISYDVVYTKMDIFDLSLSDGDIRLPAHLGLPIFTSFIIIYVLYFLYAVVGFHSLTINEY